MNIDLKQLISENMTDYISVLDVKGCYVYISSSKRDALGMNDSNDLGRSIFEFIHPDDKKSIEQAFFKMHETKQICLEECRFLTSSDQWIYIQTVGIPVFDKKGDIEYIVAVSRDISEKYQAQETQKRLTSILQNTSDIVCMFDVRGGLLYCNDSAKKIIGLNFTDFSQYSIQDIQPRWAADQMVKEALSIAIKQGSWQGRSAYLNQKCREVEVSLLLLAHRKDGKVEYFSTVARELSLIEGEKRVKISELILEKTLKAQEQERKRLAQELHDGIGQSLYSVLIGIQAIHSVFNEDEQFKGFFKEIISELEKVTNEVKRYSLELRPKMLDEFGLIPAIENLLQLNKLVHPDIHFYFDCKVELNLNPMIELHLLRIFQEALHNSLKYSEATQIAITLKKEGEFLFLTIKDNGIGFETNPSQEGLGLRHMEERTRLINAQLVINRSLGKGTEIIIKIWGRGRS